MPQLIAMVIVVVGAMIYMFQTFGGTGDKIEGIAQKTSIVTEINNVRNGLQLAVRAGDIVNDGTTLTTLKDLADLGYFADQMNTEISNNVGATTPAAGTDTSGTLNTYSAISFGGEDTGTMLLNLVTNDTEDTTTTISNRPGIRVELRGVLADNGGFLESQLATDLSSIATIDRTTVNGTAVVLDVNGNAPAANRPTTETVTTTGTTTAAGTVATTNALLTDGIFTVYFKDTPANVEQ